MLDGFAHLIYLANTVERLCAALSGSATGSGDAACSQITLGNLVVPSSWSYRGVLLVGVGRDGESESGEFPHSSFGDDDALWTHVHVHVLLHVVHVHQRLHYLYQHSP